ncbi:V-type H+-transporting ATPase subunit d [Nematocida ausubeli]|nr:V-type H+-transporting ATPase subunit d [Nematocida ausubeli]
MYGETGIINYVHGNKNMLLKEEHYRIIKAANDLDDLKVKLQSTIYGKYLLESKTSLASFKSAMYKCIDQQIKITRSFTTDKSSALIDFYKEKYQLDNFIYLWACKKESPKLLETEIDTHPLGGYPGLDFIKVTQSAKDTWKYCLENTSLSKYVEGLDSDLLNRDIQYVKSVLQKRYIEFVYDYCMKNDLCLSELIVFEGDKIIIEILYALMNGNMSTSEKLSLFPRCNSFTNVHKELLLNCKNTSELEGVLSTHIKYRNIVGNEMGVEDALLREEIRLCNKSFYIYDDYSVVYTQLILQEIEVRNIIFLADCVIQGHNHRDDIVNVTEN